MICALLVAVLAGAEDWRSRTISNAKCLALLGIGVIFQLSRMLAPGPLTRLPWEAALDVRLAPPAVCLGSAVVALVVLAAIEHAVRTWRGVSGLGYGDVKYLAAWASILGPAVALGLGAACLAGAIFALMRHERTFALGPWIGLACSALLIVIPLA